MLRAALYLRSVDTGFSALIEHEATVGFLSLHVPEWRRSSAAPALLLPNCPMAQFNFQLLIMETTVYVGVPPDRPLPLEEHHNAIIHL